MTVYVLHADFKDLPADTFTGIDHVITDPPYSSHVHDNAVSNGQGGPVDRDFGFACLTPEDQQAALRIMARVPGWSIVFSDFAKGSDAFEGDPEAEAQAGHFVLEGDCSWRVLGVHLGLEWVRLVPWIRWSQPQITGDRPPTGAEAVLHFHGKDGRKNRRKRWTGSGSLTHYSRKLLRGDDKHPAEKPLGLMLDLVSWFTEPGQAILDPFGGHGTTGLAAGLLGRDALIIEKHGPYAAVAAERCAEGAALSDRDRRAAQDWRLTTIAQAQAELAEKSTTEPARVRARARIADAERIAA